MMIRFAPLSILPDSIFPRSIVPISCEGRKYNELNHSGCDKKTDRLYWYSCQHFMFSNEYDLVNKLVIYILPAPLSTECFYQHVLFYTCCYCFHAYRLIKVQVTKHLEFSHQNYPFVQRFQPSAMLLMDNHNFCQTIWWLKCVPKLQTVHQFCD